MDWRAAGGIGRALNGLSEGILARRAKDRQEGIQDEQLSRVRQSWDEAQQRQAGMDLTGAQKAYRMADPEHLATAQLADYETSLNGTPAAPSPAPATGQGQAAPPAPAPGAPATGLVNPESALGRRLAEMKGPAPAAAPARQAQITTPGLALPQGAPSAVRQTTMEVDPKAISQGLVEPGNIPLKGRPLIGMGGGQVGSEYSVSFNQDGKEVLVPTIFDGQQHSPQEAWQHYLQTGQHLGKYATPEDANRAAEVIHQREYSPGGSLDQSRPPAPALTAAAPAQVTPPTASAAAPPPQQPQAPVMSDTLKGLHEQELAYTREAQEAERRIYAYAQAHWPNDPMAGQRMLSAWMDMKEKDPDFQKWKTGVESYKTTVDNTVRNRKAQEFVEAVRRGDQKTIQTMYGPNAKIGTDPTTKLPGIDIGNGTFVGQGQIFSDAMLKSGLIDAKEYTKQTKDNADNMTKIMLEAMKEKRQTEMEKWKEGQANFRARISLQRNTTIEVANEIEKTAMDLEKETNPTKRAALQAKLDHLQVQETRANTYASVEGQKAMDKLEGRKRQKVQDALTWAAPDTMKGRPAKNPVEVAEKFKALAREDIDMARTFALNYTPPEGTKVNPVLKALSDLEGQSSGGVEDIRARGGSNAKPAAGGGQRTQFRDKITGKLVWFRMKGDNWERE